MDNLENFYTQFVQAVGKKEGAVSPEITASASFAYGSAEMAEKIFDGSAKKPLYARMGNPTTSKLENIIAQMDGGVGAIATSSGMGATSLVALSLLQAGDAIISIGGLFGGTYSLFHETLSRFGIKTSFFDVDELDKIESAITDATKMIFLESVGNPNMRLADIQKIADIASKYKVAFVVDNTITPLSIQPLALGADIVVYSTTKIITGNASALGGCAVFRAVNTQSDKFLSPRYPFMHKFIDKTHSMALIANAKKRALRDFGMSANAHASYQTLLGLETLPLRMQHISQSIEKIVKALEKQNINVNHPSLPTHPHHQRYKKNFAAGCGTLFTIDMGSKEAAFAFLNRSELVHITANIGDSRTLALHMASTIYKDFDEKTKEFLGITPGLVRISIGLEHPDDIIKDFLKAAKL
jgi:O-acetylhomoserine (thiol)-lyase